LVALGVVLLLGGLGMGLVLLYFPVGPDTLRHLPIGPITLPHFSAGPDAAKSRPTSAPSALVPEDKLTSFGASEQSWNRAHRRIAGTNGYDPDETLPAVDVHHGRYSSVEMVDGRVVGFVMAFHPGTPIARARREIMLEFPPDASVVRFTEEAKCAQMDVNSPTLARALGSLDLEGRAYVHFMTANPNFTWGYNPAEVTAVQIERNPMFARSNFSC
jgi:hypothetical protein